MEMKGDLLTAAATEKKPAKAVELLMENFRKKETGQQNNTDKKSSLTPAPFYDELHFADYE
jgi:hypothetical protein